MNITAKQELRSFIEKALASHVNRSNFANNESLFISGKLDFLTMSNLIMYLERNFGVDFSYDKFEVELIDLIDVIELLVDSKKGE